MLNGGLVRSEGICLLVLKATLPWPEDPLGLDVRGFDSTSGQTQPSNSEANTL